MALNTRQPENVRKSELQQQLSTEVADIGSLTLRKAADILCLEGSSAEEGKFYLLTDPRGGRYLRLTERDQFIWQQIDGKTDLLHVASAYLKKYGCLPFPRIGTLAAELNKHGFVEYEPRLDAAGERTVPADEGAIGLARRLARAMRGLTLRVPFRSGIRLIYRLAWIIATDPAVAALALLALLGGLLFAANTRASHYGLFAVNGSYLGGLLTLVLLNFLVSLCRELYQGLILSRAGQYAPALGVTVRHVLPEVFLDIRQLYATPRLTRIAILLGGVFAEAAIAGACGVVLAIAPLSPAASIAFKLALVCYIRIFAGLCPLINTDAYLAASELLRTPLLRERAFSFLSRELGRRLHGGAPLSREERACVLFIGYSAAWTILAARLAGHLGRLYVAPALSHVMLSAIIWERILAAAVIAVVCVPAALFALYAIYLLLRSAWSWTVAHPIWRVNLRLGTGMALFALVLVAAYGLIAMPDAGLAATLIKTMLVVAGIYLVMLVTNEAALSGPVGRSYRFLAFGVLLLGFHMLGYLGPEIRNVTLGCYALMLVALMSYAISWNRVFTFMPQAAGAVEEAVAVAAAAGVVLTTLNMGRPDLVSRIAGPGIGLITMFTLGWSASRLRKSEMVLPWVVLVMLTIVLTLSLVLDPGLGVGASSAGISSQGATNLRFLGILLFVAAAASHFAVLRRPVLSDTAFPLEVSGDDASRLSRSVCFLCEAVLASFVKLAGRPAGRAVELRFNQRSERLQLSLRITDGSLRDDTPASASIQERGELYRDTIMALARRLSQIVGARVVDRFVLEACRRLRQEEQAAVRTDVLAGTPWSARMETGIVASPRRKSRLLKSLFAFQGLSEHELEALSSCLRNQPVGDGAQLIRQGDSLDAFHVVRRGHLVAGESTPPWPLGFVGRLGPGDAFGDRALSEDGLSHPVALTAAGDAETFLMRRDDFRAFCNAYPEAGRLVQERLHDLNQLRHIKLFEEFSDGLRETVIAGFRMSAQPSGQTIIEQGISPDKFYFVKSGRLVQGVVREGLQIIAEVSYGACLGESALLRGDPSPYMVATRSQATLLTIDRAALYRILGGDPFAITNFALGGQLEIHDTKRGQAP